MPDGFEPRKVRPSHRRFYGWGCGGDEVECMGVLRDVIECKAVLRRGPTEAWRGAAGATLRHGGGARQALPLPSGCVRARSSYPTLGLCGVVHRDGRD